MKRIPLLLLGIVCLGFTLIDYNTYNMKNINTFLTDQIDNNETPSLQYAFFDTDSTIYEFQYGQINRSSSEAIDEKTTYNIFSVTKTFTALAVLQLAQQGKLGLTHPVSDYLPGFGYDPTITVEQLLSHTAGIPNPLPLKWIHLESEHESFRHDDFFAEVFSKHPKLDFKPGTDFKYSNLGYVVLGQLIERVSGQPFKEYIQSHIIKPCGIDSAELGFNINPSVHAVGYHKWWSASNAVLGFLIDKNKFMEPRQGNWKPFKLFYTNGLAYGGMIGSGRALISYAQTLLKENSPLISDRYKQELFTERNVNGKPTGMSFSWFTGTLKGNRYYAHAGGGGGYYVELRVYPDLGVGSVILYNRTGMTDERILSKADGFFITERNEESILASLK